MTKYKLENGFEQSSPLKTIRFSCLLILMGQLLLIHNLYAQSESYPESLPKPSEVIADIKGRTDIETGAKQVAAFKALNLLIMINKPGGKFSRSSLSPVEQARLESYGKAQREIVSRYRTKYKDEPKNWKKFTNLRWDYEGDPSYQRDIILRYAPNEVDAIDREHKEIHAAGENAVMNPEDIGKIDPLTYVISTIFFAVIALYTNKRLFGKYMPYDKVTVITYFSRQGGKTGESTEYYNAIGVAVLTLMIFGWSALGLDFFVRSSIFDRLLVLSSIPITGVTMFFSWKIIKYLVIIGIALWLFYEGYQFVVNA